MSIAAINGLPVTAPAKDSAERETAAVQPKNETVQPDVRRSGMLSRPPMDDPEWVEEALTSAQASISRSEENDANSLHGGFDMDRINKLLDLDID
jgi:hypothetical protein